MPNVYSLLVGINNYQNPVSPLRGCLNDVAALEQYLMHAYLDEDDYSIHVKKLLNEQATKEGICEAFLTHLGQAREDDIALFYYSGHGTQEYADTTFWVSESDGKHESLICYDSIPQGLNVADANTRKANAHNYKFLADKELRYLIQKVASQGAHVLTIFDCCHSGDITRNSFVPANWKDLVERRFPRRFGQQRAFTFPRRPMTNFLFWNEAFEQQYYQKKSFEELLPEGSHIQLTACRSDESAYEFNEDGAFMGVFSRNLIEVLERSKGGVTYYDLKSRVYRFLKSQFFQEPQMYSTGESSSLFQTFLGKSLQTRPLYGNVLSPKGSNSWLIDIGSMKGLSTLAKVRIETEEKTIDATITRIDLGESYLVIPPEDLRHLDESMVYPGYIEGQASAPISLHLDTEVPAIKELAEQLTDLKNVNIVQEKQLAEYIVSAENSHYSIFSAKDMDGLYPLVKQEDLGQYGANQVAAYLNQIARWNFVKNLQNSSPKVFHSFPFKVEILRELEDGSLLKTNIDKGVVELPLRSIVEDYRSILTTNIQIKVTNLFQHTLYLSVLFLGQDFGIDSGLIAHPHSTILGSGETYTLVGTGHSELRLIRLDMFDYAKDAKWPYEEACLKFIASNRKAHLDEAVSQFSMEGLPPPELGDTRFGSSTKGLYKRSYDYKNAPDDWITKSVCLKLMPSG